MFFGLGPLEMLIVAFLGLMVLFVFPQLLLLIIPILLLALFGVSL